MDSDAEEDAEEHDEEDDDDEDNTGEVPSSIRHLSTATVRHVSPLSLKPILANIKYAMPFSNRIYIVKSVTSQALGAALIRTDGRTMR